MKNPVDAPAPHVDVDCLNPGESHGQRVTDASVRRMFSALYEEADVNDSIKGFMPCAPLWHLDWTGIDSAFAWISKLRGSTQDPIHHAEGDVWTHVAMVVSEMVSSPEWRSLPDDERLETFAAALLHDVCKPETRAVDEDGHITNRGHSKAGANEARQILWRMGWPLDARERVCAMIRVHQIPFWLLERPVWQANALLVETSLSVPNRLLSVLADADARGRKCVDRQGIVDAVELFRDAARELGCYDEPFGFANDHARFRYFQSPQTRQPGAPIWDDTDSGFTVTVASGLPGMGKSSLIKKATAAGGFLEGQPVVSLDGLREEMDVDPSGNQGRVVQAAKERAREFLRIRRSFVWDGTNVSQQMRSQPVSLAADYGARVRIAYVEVGEAEMRAQNRSRDEWVVDKAVAKMMRRWEMPTLAECHDIDLSGVVYRPRSPRLGHGSAPGR